MRLLVLGGSVFLSRAVAAEALRRGHEVTCACRGTSGPLPVGVRHVEADRTGELPAELVDTDFDAVVDVARHPSWVRRAVTSLPGPHWVFVSTINVYSDNQTPDGRPGTIALLHPVHTDEDPTSGPEVYGAMKVSCEQSVAQGASSSMVIRPGLIVGPEDPTGRFTYWPSRLADGGEVLAPGAPEDRMQVIDVRDLATWIVDSCESRRAGVFDGVGPAMPMAELLTEALAGVAQLSSAGQVETRFTWVSQAFLEEQGVEPWSGDDAVPLWLPSPAYDGMRSHDAQPSLAAGLRLRSVAETARDTLAWRNEHPDAAVTGIGRARERELLAAWHAREP